MQQIILLKLDLKKLNRSYYNEWFVRQNLHDIFFYLGLLSQTFTNHRPAGEGRGHFLNSSQPLPTASDTETLISLEVTVENLPLHIVSDQVWTSKALVSEPKALTTKRCSLILPRAWLSIQKFVWCSF